MRLQSQVERYENTLKANYRQIFVVENSHDVSALSAYTGNIRFLLSGYEEPAQIKKAIEEALNVYHFDPRLDAVVPIGKNLYNLLLGAVLARYPVFTLGLYTGKEYTFATFRSDL
jgi:hypothetical protein